MIEINSTLVTILVHFNAASDTINIAKELLNIPIKNHKIIIVDNQSAQTQYNLIVSALLIPNVYIIRNGKNNGYGGGINFGYKYAIQFNPKYIHVLNTDTKILNPKYIFAIMNQFEKDTRVGIIGPLVRYSNGQVQNTIMPNVSLINALLFKKKINKSFNTINNKALIQVEVVNGVCFVIRSKVFSDIGGFDEDYFMYGEEQDLCYRVKNAGYQIYFSPIESIEHKEIHKNDSLKIDWRYLLVRSNQIQFLNKHKNIISGKLLAILFIISLILKLMKQTKTEGINFKMLINAYFRPKWFNKYLSQSF